MTQQVINLKGHEHRSLRLSPARSGRCSVRARSPARTSRRKYHPPDVYLQVRNAFINMQARARRGRHGLEDVAKLTIYLADEKYRDAAIMPWAQTFPDPNRRPTRRTLLVLIHAWIAQVGTIAYKA